VVDNVMDREEKRILRGEMPSQRSGYRLSPKLRVLRLNTT